MVKTLGEFIQQYMEDEHLSAYDLADKFGCSHTTISKFAQHGIKEKYSGRPIGDPDFAFVRTLASITKTEAITICAFIVGEKVKDVSPEDLVLVQTVNTLSDESKKDIHAIIRAMRQRQKNTSA